MLKLLDPTCKTFPQGIIDSLLLLAAAFETAAATPEPVRASLAAELLPAQILFFSLLRQPSDVCPSGWFWWWVEYPKFFRRAGGTRLSPEL